VWLPVALSLAAYLVMGYGVGKPYGEAGDPSYFIRAGQAGPRPHNDSPGWMRWNDSC